MCTVCFQLSVSDEETENLHEKCAIRVAHRSRYARRTY